MIRETSIKCSTIPLKDFLNLFLWNSWTTFKVFWRISWTFSRELCSNFCEIVKKKSLKFFLNYLKKVEGLFKYIFGKKILKTSPWLFRMRLFRNNFWEICGRFIWAPLKTFSRATLVGFFERNTPKMWKIFQGKFLIAFWETYLHIFGKFWKILEIISEESLEGIFKTILRRFRGECVEHFMDFWAEFLKNILNNLSIVGLMKPTLNYFLHFFFENFLGKSF